MDHTHFEVVKVLDFGVAKDLSGRHGDLTGAGEVLGTPRYMAPEQVLGRSVAPPTDLYALGLVLAEALTGAAVVSSDNHTQAVATQARDEDLPLDAVVLDSPLGSVIRRATRKKMGARFASAHSMRLAVESVIRRMQGLATDEDSTCSVRTPGVAGDASTGVPVSVAKEKISGAVPTTPIATHSRWRWVAAAAAITASIAAAAAWRWVPRVDMPGPQSPAVPSLHDSVLDSEDASSPVNDPLPDGFDPASFDLVGFVPVASARARALLPDAELTKLSAAGIWSGNHVDVRRQGAMVVAEFRSPAASVPAPGHPINLEYRASCLVTVVVDDRGLTVSTAYDTCVAPILGRPRCTPEQVLRQYFSAIDAGGDLLHVSLQWGTDDDGIGRWRVEAEPLDYKYLADDCR